MTFEMMSQFPAAAISSTCHQNQEVHRDRGNQVVGHRILGDLRSHQGVRRAGGNLL
jgi:hypothetical protein